VSDPEMDYTPSNVVTRLRDIIGDLREMAYAGSWSGPYLEHLPERLERIVRRIQGRPEHPEDLEEPTDA
jgi:hypothetical protein